MIRPSLFLSRRTPVTGLFLFSSFALALASGAVACGVRTPLTDGLDDFATSSAKDAGTTSQVAPPAPDASTFDAGIAIDAGESIEDAEADVALPPNDLGDIFLTTGIYGTVAKLNVSAEFYPSVAATGCAVTAVAGCQLETCTLPSTGNPLLANAGAIAITGGTFPLLLQQGPGGLYTTPVVAPDDDGGSDDGGDAEAPVPNLPLWHGGEQLFVNASGADVAPFVTNLVAPSQITVTTPIPATIARTAALNVQWFKQSAGQVTVDVSSADGATKYYLECKFDVVSGAGVVPQAALAGIPGGSGAITVASVSKTTVYSGAWTVGTFAQTNAVDGNGNEFSAPVEIQ